MRVFLLILVLIFSLQSNTKADDIREFEIEGISIGDSLLDHFTKAEIEEDRLEFTQSSNKRYSYSEISNIFKEYTNLQFFYKRQDSNYKIESIGGILFYENNIDECLLKKEEILKNIKTILSDETKISEDVARAHSESYPNSLIWTTNFQYKNEDLIRIYCTDWSNDIENSRGWTDHLSISFLTKDFIYFLDNEAY